MSIELTSRMRKALRILREECDYDDAHKGGTDNFVLSNRLAPGIGEKTLSELIRMGLIMTGPNRWFKEIGYRITDLGRKALEQKLSPKNKRPTQRLKPLPPRLNEIKDRFDR